MDVEQRFVIKFLLHKNFNNEEIITELQYVYGDDVYSQSSIYFWISEIRRGRTDLLNHQSPGRPIDDQITLLVLRELENYPFVSARIIAKRICVAISTVSSHLHNSLKMKNIFFRGVPHLLTEQKRKLELNFQSKF